ncbi:MAG: hypothetical protein H0V63_14005, partial [Burkholderiaceae bacterium]|nr:hypothetical protein [Burkholderiaceae bacterium]
MTVLDELIVRFRVDLDQLSTGLAKARTAVASVATRMGDSFKGLGRAIGAVTDPANLLRAFLVGRLAQAFFTTISNTLQTVDALGKLSDRLGIATEKLAGLQYAARMAGVESGTLTQSLTIASRTLSQAAAGADGASETFRSLGLSIADLRRLSPDQQFAAYADALAGVSNAADRARLAQELFGRGGASLIPLLIEGSAGLKSMQTEAEKLGIAVSRVDAAKAEQANDAIEKIKVAFEGIKTIVAIEIAPALAALANVITNNVTATNGFRDSVSGLGEKMIGVVGMMMDGAAIVAQAWNLVKIAFLSIQVPVSWLMENLTEGILQWGANFRALAAIVEAVADVIGSSFKAVWLETKSAFLSMTGAIENGFSAMLHKLADGLSYINDDAAKKTREAADSMAASAGEGADAIAKELDAAYAGAAGGLLALDNAMAKVGDYSDIGKNPFKGSFDAAKVYFNETWEAIVKKSGEPLPSIGFKASMIEAMAAVQAEADKTGKRVADALSPATGMSDDEAKQRRAKLENDLGNETALEKAAFEERLANLNALHDAERISDDEYDQHRRSLTLMRKEEVLGDMDGDLELEAENHQVRMDAISEAYALELVTYQEHLDLMAQAKEDHEARTQKIVEKKAIWEQKFDRFMSSRKVQGARQMFTDLSSLMDSHSRKAFEVGKVAAIANATVNGIQAAVAAFGAGMQSGA